MHREHGFLLKNGSWQWHTQSITPVYDKEGKILEIQGICHDVTEKRSSDEILRNANRQLNLLSGITRHDILNKITAIHGYITISEMENSNPVISEYLKKMKNSTNLIQEQIEFTRLYQDLGSQDPKWMDLHEALSYLSMPDSITQERNLKNVSVFSDPMLEKVFFNLLDNSIRHGQYVTKITIGSHISGDNLIITWEDNGIGIHEDEKEKIFERGYGKNTGLGLFLSREILSITGITIK
ncbi:MAG: hypothetical protein HGA23_06130 [Bacteroidales bacterium]|nr:hypothetical protein [Bacteroidales bacterium]